MEKTGDPTMLAPEICVEVLSSSNTEEEIKEKRALYREAGADEVWVVDKDNQIRVYRDEEMDHSHIAPDCPTQL
jgi:Uma2 family endonuclease